MHETLKDNAANVYWIYFKQTAEKGWNWKNKWETRPALSALWHLPSIITLTLAEAFTESTSSNDLLQVQAVNLCLVSGISKASETFLLEVNACHTIATGFSRIPVVASYEHNGSVRVMLFTWYIRFLEVTWTTFLLNLFTVKNQFRENVHRANNFLPCPTFYW